MARRLVGEGVSYRNRGPAAVITIHRPERRNAIDGPTADALEQAYDCWLEDDSAKVLILTGEGTDAFCAGADLKAIATLQPRVSGDSGPLGFTRRISPKPTIAAIEGWCVAGGLELAAWCDLRIAGSGARLGCTERRFGVPLIDGGTQRLPRIIGLGRALDLILTGRVIDAEEALGIGLLTRVVPEGGALEAAASLAEDLADHPPAALLADRRSAHLALGVDLAAGLRQEAVDGADAVGEGSLGADRFADGEGRHGSSIPPRRS